MAELALVASSQTRMEAMDHLGRAYYRKGRFEDANMILQRALVVNKEDEIAWLVLGATQLRLNQNAKGLESMKGGITLLSKVSVDGYRDYPVWDSRKIIRASINRVAFLLTKEEQNKEEILAALNTLLSPKHEEDNFQPTETLSRYRREY